jgi:hypothetical protein
MHGTKVGFGNAWESVSLSSRSVQFSALFLAKIDPYFTQISSYFAASQLPLWDRVVIELAMKRV